jgi:hypothetical protein
MRPPEPAPWVKTFDRLMARFTIKSRTSALSISRKARIRAAPSSGEAGDFLILAPRRALTVLVAEPSPMMSSELIGTM